MKKEEVFYFDVVVVGAGPGGGQCARKLAQNGVNVLLVEKFNSFEDNNFSSAGMLYETIEEFDIPLHVVGAYWNNIMIESSKKSYHWKSNQVKGAVLNFARLRQFLAEECEKFGGTVWMGHRFVKKSKIKQGILLEFKNSQSNEPVFVEAKLVVDATGPARKVIYEKEEIQVEMLVGTAVEYLIEVPQDVYDKYKNDLVFFLGKKWADEAYSWIFPMENRLLKVGSGKYFYEKSKSRSSKELTEKVIHEYLGLDHYKLINAHGGTYRYSLGLKDVFYKDGVVGVGDTISSFNLLGGEGIRYAMLSANMLVPHIQKYIHNPNYSFEKFKKEFRKKYYFKWRMSELIAKKVYNYSDEKIEIRLKQYANKFAKIDDLIDVLFHYNYKKVALKIVLALFREKLNFKRKEIRK